jgi:hypothetical protein
LRGVLICQYPLQHLLAERGFEMVRYADHFVMCRTLEEATGGTALVKKWTASAGLTLHPTKTRLVDERKDGFDFLGDPTQGRGHCVPVSSATRRITWRSRPERREASRTVR